MAYPKDSGAFRVSSGFAARCARGLLLACAVLGAAAATAALERMFPAGAKKAQFAISEYPAVLVDGKPRRLSAAAQIRSAENLIVMPSTLGAAKYAVRYTADFQGDIDRVWILTAAEARAR